MRKLKAFSLVEMLITLGLMSIILLIATQTLNTVFRVSTINKLKTVTRNEVGFATELTERLLANSNVVDVYLYTDPQNTEVRFFNEETGQISSELSSEQLQTYYSDTLSTGDVGTEIHFRPYGYSVWVCLGYFHGYDSSTSEPTTDGYFLKRTINSFGDKGHESCFDTDPVTGFDTDDYPILILNSDDVNVNYFKVSYIKSSDINNVFYVDFEMEPNYWIAGSNSVIEKSVFRQAIITTQGLTWY